MTTQTDTYGLRPNSATSVVVRAARLTLATLCVINALKSVDRVLLGILTPDIKAEFHFSDTSLGMLSVAYGVAYAFFAIPLGYLADHASRKGLISLVLAIWSGMTALSGVAVSFSMLFFARVGVAIGESGFMSSAVSMVSDYFPARLRNLALGLLHSFSSLGVFIGLALGGWLAATYGWRAAFLVLGIPGLLMAIWVFFGLRDVKRGATDEIAYETKTGTQVWTLLWHNRLYVWIVILTSFNIFAANGLVQWLPSFFARSHGMDIAKVGLSFGTVFGVGMIIGQLVGGALATKMAKGGLFQPLIICVWSNFLLIPCYLAVFLVPNATLSLALIFVGAFLGAVGHAPQVACAQTALPPNVRGMGHALLSFGSAVVAMGLGPFVVGLLSDMFADYGSAHALRYALCCSLLFFVVATLASWRAYQLGTRAEPVRG